MAFPGVKLIGPLVVASLLSGGTVSPPTPRPSVSVPLLHAHWPSRSVRARLIASISGNVKRPESNPVREVVEPESQTPRLATRPGGSAQITDVSDAKIGSVVSIAPSSFDTFTTAYDPAIAVGHKYLLVISDHKISFYGRDGKLLPSKNGEKTSLSATEFFSAFWEPKRPDGTVNDANVNAHLGFPSNTLTVDPQKDPSGQLGAINEFYDSRCCYDRASRRFIFLSAARNQLWFNDPKTNPGGKYDGCVRRYFAFALSKTEDPRDGFNQWITLESNYADWPRMSLANGSFLVAHNSPESGKPFATVFRYSDMQADKAAPANWRYYAADFPSSAKVLPVSIYGDSFGASYFVGVTKPTWNPIKVYGFSTPSSWNSKAPLYTADIDLSTPMDFHIDNPKFRNHAIYFCSNLKVVSDRYHVRVARVPTVWAGNKIVCSTGAGYWDHYFGRNGPGDAPDDLVSYLRPALAVNKNGDCAIVYGRVGVTTAKPLYPEARYSLFYHNESKPRPSSVLRTGDFSPSKSITDRLDLVNATVDPIDDTTLWFCHGYAKKSVNDYMMVVGKVKP